VIYFKTVEISFKYVPIHLVMNFALKELRIIQY